MEDLDTDDNGEDGYNKDRSTQSDMEDGALTYAVGRVGLGFRSLCRAPRSSLLLYKRHLMYISGATNQA